MVAQPIDSIKDTFKQAQLTEFSREMSYGANEKTGCEPPVHRLHFGVTKCCCAKPLLCNQTFTLQKYATVFKMSKHSTLVPPILHGGTVHGFHNAEMLACVC